LFSIATCSVAIVERDKAPAVLRLHNARLVLNVGAGPTEDKSDVTLTPPQDLATVSGFLNIRVADIEAVHASWAEKGAAFLTAPTDRGSEIRCYLRDPDGHLIEVGQTKAPAVSAWPSQPAYLRLKRKETTQWTTPHRSPTSS
jgi:hypothetical protein